MPSSVGLVPSSVELVPVSEGLTRPLVALVAASSASATDVGSMVSCGGRVGTNTKSGVGNAVPPYGEPMGHSGLVVTGLSVAIEGKGLEVGDCGLTAALGQTTAWAWSTCSARIGSFRAMVTRFELGVSHNC